MFNNSFFKKVPAFVLLLPVMLLLLASCAKSPEAASQGETQPPYEAAEPSYARAQAFYSAGQADMAEQECLALLLKEPDRTDVLCLLADIVRQRDSSAALEAVLDRLFAGGVTAKNLPYLEYYEFIDAGAITWYDPVVEQKVREYLGIPDGQPVYQCQLDDIVDITIYADEWHIFTSDADESTRTASYSGAALPGLGGVTSLRDFANFKNLEYLGVSYNAVSSVDARLYRLRSLTELSFRGNYITDISTLGRMLKLEYIDISDNPVSDLSPLTALSHLNNLDISYCPVRDPAPVGALGALSELYCVQCCLTDVAFAAQLTSLEVLDLGGNDITDLSPLAGLGALRTLRLDGNERLSDLSPILNSGVEELWLSGTAVDGDSPLPPLAGPESIASGRSY